MIKILSALSSCQRRRITAVLFVLIALAAASGNVAAHPLGNFSVNHFARIETGSGRVRIHYVIDMAEIPTFQESQSIDTNTDGKLSGTELNVYLERVASQYADGLVLTVDNARLQLQATAKNISTGQGSGNLPTLRVECDFEGVMPATGSTMARLHFEDTNYGERLGWREIVVVPASGVAVFDSSAFGSSLTDELKAYPEDMLAAPLAERTADFSFSTGAMPTGAQPLRTREGRSIAETQDSFAGLIAVPELTFGVALLGLVFAGGLGALHALSPGHGKTVVGAYLVGSRGTPRHAVYLGLTVTITHTLGVFALGLVAIFASEYVLPERLFPVLALLSGAIVLVIGLSLFVRRLRAALGHGTRSHAHHYHAHPHAHTHDHAHDHEHDHAHAHDHAHGDASSLTHSHGGTTHTHLPPGADGSPVTWRSLLALGISGGLLPCPSALVVLLSAISLHRVGYGLALVFAFSVGLAATLMAIGLMFVFAGRFIGRPAGDNRLVRWLPIVSAFVVACIGAGICFNALGESGFHLSTLTSQLAGGDEKALLASPGGFALLGLGLVFGLKHATEADHVVAVSTIVSEHRNLLRAALVGGLWGVGHTVSLVVVGMVVLALRIAIPERVATWLEFGVALMIIGLGINALMRALRGRADVHVHVHAHDEGTHAHIHFHEDGTEHAEPVAAHSHAVSRVGIKPLLVGAVHGLAGSAALTLLVLTQIDSFMLGLLYLALFGIGSICGMLLMSGLIGLPFALSARRLTGFNYGLQTVAGAVSIAFGLWYAYATGVIGGL